MQSEHINSLYSVLGKMGDFGFLKFCELDLNSAGKMLRSNKKKEKFIVVIFTCILFLAVPLPCEGALAHMWLLSASFPICKIIRILDPQLTGVLGSPGR